MTKACVHRRTPSPPDRMSDPTILAAPKLPAHAGRVRRLVQHLDLFSGIGGFAIAAQAAGCQTIGFSEIEPYACKVLKHHWPKVPNYGDIRNIRGVSADLVTGGFPCQPFSVAGHKRGSEDDRHLWPEMLRVIAEAGPSWVLGENVPGIIGMELDNVLSDLENIGYAAWPVVIPACAVDARHRRDRVWIMAHSERGRLQERRAEGAGGMGDGACSRQEASHDLSATPQSGYDVAESGCWSGEGSRSGIGSETRAARWDAEPGMDRVADGIPNRTHRLRGLGNSIVPQVAAEIIRGMMAVDSLLNAEATRPAGES